MGGFFPDNFGKTEQQVLGLGLVWLILLQVHNLGLDLMDVDSAQYASITLEMSLNHSHLQVYHHGEDYLDKPPLLFWLSILPFRIFGVSDFWFRLPSLLIAWLGIWSLYRLVKTRHSASLAFYSVVAALSTQSFFQFVHDVRTDTLLTGFSLFSLLHLSQFIKHHKRLNLLAAAFGIGLAMLAKGPLGFLIPACGVFCELLFTRQLRILLDPRWLLLPLVVALVLAPMAYGLYIQFDQHPEKFVYGLQGPSGLRFFFWTQSFGRITGENYWDNNAPWHFLLGTSLWDGLPWVLLMWYGLIRNLMKKNSTRDYLMLGAFILPFLALAGSKYQLPHYIFPLLPIGAFFTALELNKSDGQPGGKSKFLLLLPSLLLPVAGLLIAGILFPQGWGVGIVYALFTAGLGIFISTRCRQSVFILSFYAILLFYSVMSFIFYPELMKYQAGSVAGKYVKQHHPQSTVWFYREGSHALDVYSGKISREISSPDELQRLNPGDVVFCQPDDSLRKQLAIGKFAVCAAFANYPVTNLRYAFLHPKTRTSQLQYKLVFKKL